LKHPFINGCLGFQVSINWCRIPAINNAESCSIEKARQFLCVFFVWFRTYCGGQICNLFFFHVIGKMNEQIYWVHNVAGGIEIDKEWRMVLNPIEVAYEFMISSSKDFHNFKHWKKNRSGSVFGDLFALKNGSSSRSKLLTYNLWARKAAQQFTSHIITDQFCSTCNPCLKSTFNPGTPFCQSPTKWHTVFIYTVYISICTKIDV